MRLKFVSASSIRAFADATCDESCEISSLRAPAFIAASCAFALSRELFAFCSCVSKSLGSRRPTRSPFAIFCPLSVGISMSVPATRNERSTRCDASTLPG